MPEGAGSVALDGDDGRWQAGLSIVHRVREPAIVPDRGAKFKSVHKQAATLQAQAAIAGVRLDAIDDDRGHVAWIVTKLSLTHQCATLDEVREVLLQIGVRL